MTFQACSISEARNLYDQLAVVTPIVVSVISYHVEMTIDAISAFPKRGQPRELYPKFR